MQCSPLWDKKSNVKLLGTTCFFFKGLGPRVFFTDIYIIIYKIYLNISYRYVAQDFHWTCKRPCKSAGVNLPPMHPCCLFFMAWLWKLGTIILVEFQSIKNNHPPHPKNREKTWNFQESWNEPHRDFCGTNPPMARIIWYKGMSRKVCTTPARESDLEVKIFKNWRCRSTFGSSHRQNLHHACARERFGSQNR